MLTKQLSGYLWGQQWTCDWNTRKVAGNQTRFVFSHTPAPSWRHIRILCNRTFTVNMSPFGSILTLIKMPALAMFLIPMPSPGTASSSPEVKTCVQSMSSPLTFTLIVTVAGSSHLEKNIYFFRSDICNKWSCYMILNMLISSLRRDSFQSVGGAKSCVDEARGGEGSTKENVE